MSAVPNLVESLRPEFERLRRRFPAGFDSSLVLPCLRRIQEERGFIAEEDIEALVAWLGVPRVQVDEVMSFYTQFRRDPVGRWHLQVCRNVSCSMRGAERLLGQLCQRLDVREGQSTPDGRFTVSTVECLGLRHGAGAGGQRDLPREHEPGPGRRAARGARVAGDRASAGSRRDARNVRGVRGIRGQGLRWPRTPRS